MDELDFAAPPNCPNCLMPMTATDAGWLCEQCGFIETPEATGLTAVNPRDYEFPDNVFGFVPDELPPLIGKVVMLAALLETKIEALASCVDNHTQDYYGGRGPTVNADTVRVRLRLYDKTPDELVFAQRTKTLLVEALDALEDRNFIVHGVWPATGRDGWWAWKPRRKKRGEESPVWIDERTLFAEDFVSLCVTLNELIDRTADLSAYAGGLGRRP